MEDLQSTLQSILSDPEQMRQIAAVAESLGLGPSAPPAEAANGRPPEAETGGMRNGEGNPGIGIPLGNLDIPALLGSLSAMNGTEDRVFGALRPSLSPAGQGKADRALRAAKLSRLAGRFLTRQRDGHV